MVPYVAIGNVVQTYHLRPPPALEHKNVCVDVLHFKPAGDGQGCVRPHPIHQCPQLQQEWNDQEAEICTTGVPLSNNRHYNASHNMYEGKLG